jgi:hypothetical protein
LKHAGQDLLGVRVPVLSVMAAFLAGIGALLSLVLGFLILGEDLTAVVPTRWLVIFAASSGGTLVLLITAVGNGRRALGFGSWRAEADARFFWETILSVAAAAALGLATAFDDGLPAYLFLAGILAAYVTLARWTWWTWRASR